MKFVYVIKQVTHSGASCSLYGVKTEKEAQDDVQKMNRASSFGYLYSYERVEIHEQ